MFDHVTIRVSDRDASERFYDTVLGAVGIEKTHAGAGLVEWDDFSIAVASEQRPVTRRLHLGFVAATHEQVDAFWRAGTAAGHRDDGPPGPRPQYREGYYGSFLLDPDGNSAEAVYHGALRQGGNVDHLWIRVADVAVSQRFYELVAAHAGFGVRAHGARHARVVGPTGSFSLVAGPPSEHVHMAFAVADDARIDAFHGAALEAGHRDGGAPGERPAYHAGYYAAYVLDPDGNNVELVDHHRP